MFTHLHLHTEYSLLDGLIKIKPLIKKIKELGMDSVAITDHGVMYGLYEFYSECKYNGIKPIIGCEVYVAPYSRFDKTPKKGKKRYHLTLLAKNEIGYHNLIKLCSLGHLEGFYTKPRVDKELLEKYSDGIIATTGCAASPVNRNLIKGKKKIAYKWAKFFKKIYKDNLYVEIQRNGVKECEDAIPKMLELAKYFELPIVATCDSHYLEKGDHNVQEINWCIRDAKLLSDTDRLKKWSDEFYVKSPAEMEELFKDLPEAIENTKKISDSVEIYSIKYNRVQPVYWNIPDNIPTSELLKEKCYIGASKKFTNTLNHLGKEVCTEWITVDLKYIKELISSEIIHDINISPQIKIRKDIKERVDYELDVINQKGYNDYFLVVSDFLNWAKNQGILCGVRGSVGGSLVAFTSGITDIDPLRWELYFERFLNPQRESPPDIDCDIQFDRRQEVVDYIKMRYKEENCSLINALGRLKTRAAIRDVSRVMGISLKIADKLSKMVIVKFGKPYSADDMMNKVSEFKEEVTRDPSLVQMIDIVKKIENMPRQSGTHACGMIITPKPIIEYTPLQLDKEGRVTAQLEMKPIEEIGLMKFDILGLINLSIIKNTVEQIRKRHGIIIDIWKIDEHDQKTFDLLQKGDTDAVFQLESEGMKKYLIDLQPTTLDDICFMCAAYRPGPMQFIKPYIDCKQGKASPQYLIPELEPILHMTYGYAIYQEQVIRIAVDIAGYSMGQADMLRRAMGKKVKEIMEGERIKFVNGCIEKGYTEEIANQLFDYLMPFADYGFNKSHSAGYAHIAYQTAFLKANYLIEFLAGLMESDLDTSDKLKRDIKIAKEKNIGILPPNINKSDLQFTIIGNDILFGLGGIKSISKKAMQELIEDRKLYGNYKNLDDLVFRLGNKLPKSSLEILIKIGALDDFGNRSALVSVITDVYKKYNSYKINSSQANLFEMMVEEPSFEPTILPLMEEFNNHELVEFELTYLNTFFSAHPLAELDLSNFDNTLNLNSSKDDYFANLIAVVRELKKINTKKGEPMCFLKLEDLHGNIEGVVFPKLYSKISKLDQLPIVNQIVHVKGKITSRELKKSIIIDEIKPVKESEINSIKVETNNKNDLTIIQQQVSKIIDKVRIDITNIEDKLELSKLKNILVNNLGPCEVIVKMNDNGTIVEKKLSSGINPTPDILSFFEKLLY